MKGTLSEMELSTFRQRSQAALTQKAKRGELHSTVAVGYLRSHDERLEMDPDQRIQKALALVFRKFRELGSVRQVLLWLREEHIELPAVLYQSGARRVVWKLPVYNTVLKILTNPVYGGAYVWGRTKTLARIENGRKRMARGKRLAQQDWEVLIIDHHPGYIAWEEYQSNQALIAHNANMKGAMVRGAANRGSALLAGLLRCGHCGRKLHVTRLAEPMAMSCATIAAAAVSITAQTTVSHSVACGLMSPLHTRFSLDCSRLACAPLWRRSRRPPPRPASGFGRWS